MDIIVSTDNSKVKNVCRLKDKKYRRQQNRFVIEGYRNVKDSADHVVIDDIFMSESAFCKFGNEFPQCIVCADNVFAKIADTDNSQGIIAVACIPNRKPDYEKSCIILDHLSDPGNLGTILRSCLATGFVNVINIGGVEFFNPKVVRSAMSALCRLNLIEVDSFDIVAMLKSKDYYVLCADMNGSNVFDCECNSDKIALIIGNEANGVSDVAVDVADKVVSLPMNEIESLNAAVCASVMMYQLKYNKK